MRNHRLKTNWQRLSVKFSDLILSLLIYSYLNGHLFCQLLIVTLFPTAERNQSTLKVQKNNSGENVTCNGSVPHNTEPTWVHEIFQGTLTSETRCLNCETVSSKDEHFFDLQVTVNFVYRN